MKESQIVAVGWNKLLHIWDVEEDEDLTTKHIFPPKSKRGKIGHQDDIMSAVYDVESNLIYTGGHDGTIFAWSLDTGSIKRSLHNFDPTCISKDFINESKSVDKLILMPAADKLLSMTADMNLRFWDLDELKEAK